MLQSLILAPLLFGQHFGTDAGLQYNPSFADFGAITESGSIQSAYGFPGVSWTAGTRPEDIITLGSIQQTGVGEFTFGQILNESGINLDGLILKDFPLLANSTLEQAADATNNDPDFLDNVLIDGNTVGEAISQGEGTKTLAQKLGIEKPLQDIQKVQDAVINKLNQWESQAIGAIPGLSAVPFARYPAQLANTSLAAISLFAKADLILDRAEKGVDNTVTGSDKEKTKFNTPCPFARQQACGHVELKDFVSTNMAGKRWINGKHQKVRGGSGVLGAIFGNKEPTGRLPFGPGSPFKLVLTKTDESTDKASFSAYFQLCEFLAGCTGYNIGPFPLYSVGIDGVIWMGVNPTDFGKVPFGFDPSVVGPPGSSTGVPPLYSPVGSNSGGIGDPGKCADANRSRPTYLWPAKGLFTSGFGQRSSPGGIGSSWHAGVDVAAPIGTSIIAGEGGEIIYSARRGGYGYTVMLRVECTGHVLLYGHNSRLLVRPGQPVKKGQVIALMGSTGISTGPHSHFEVRIGGEPVNPIHYLPPSGP
ncbi:M23 family metallopeptidase [Acaryochloris sp. IP29b_bin.137]|uniref:M23 family metallopeptidase n=1 Tax=Acaryochloris sp. IP29b_bin.137 TaxID=2969217 RepID=UPI0026167166|nr:M23 family metallopeptidase [Acaryochloris sp. IP29b_bin.137]